MDVLPANFVRFVFVLVEQNFTFFIHSFIHLFYFILFYTETEFIASPMSSTIDIEWLNLPLAGSLPLPSSPSTLPPPPLSSNSTSSLPSLPFPSTHSSVSYFTLMFFKDKKPQIEDAYVTKVRENGLHFIIPRYGVEEKVVLPEVRGGREGKGRDKKRKCWGLEIFLYFLIFFFRNM